MLQPNGVLDDSLFLDMLPQEECRNVGYDSMFVGHLGSMASSTLTMGWRTASGNFGPPGICPPVVLRSREFNSDRWPPRRPTAIWDTIVLSRLEMTADVVGWAHHRCHAHPHMSRGRMPSAGAAHPAGLHFSCFAWDSTMAVQFTDGPFRTPIWQLDSRLHGVQDRNGHLQLPYYPGSMRARPRQHIRSLSPRRPPRPPPARSSLSNSPI